MANRRGKSGSSDRFFFSWAPKSLQTSTMKLKDVFSLDKSYDQPSQHIKKQRHQFADRGPYTQSYGLSSSHVWMWELDHKEEVMPKNWCFCTVVLEKTLESLLDSKEIKPVHPKGDQSWIFIGRTDAEAEAPILWPPDVKNWLTGKTLMLGKVEGKRREGLQRMSWLDSNHQLNGHESEQTQGDREGQGTLVCCSPWGRKESDTT